MLATSSVARRGLQYRDRRRRLSMSARSRTAGRRSSRARREPGRPPGAHQSLMQARRCSVTCRSRRASKRSHCASSTRPIRGPRRQPQIRVVDAQQQPMFGSRCKHPVWLQAASVTRSSTRMPMYASSRRSVNGGFASNRARGVDPGDEPLRRRFFVARRPVDLSGEKQSLDPMRLERGLQFGRLHEIVFNRISRLAASPRPREPGSA